MPIGPVIPRFAAIGLLVALSGCGRPATTPPPSPAEEGEARQIQQLTQVIGPGVVSQQMGGLSQTIGTGLPVTVTVPVDGTGSTSTSTTVTGPGSVSSVTTSTSGGGTATSYSSTVTGNREEIRASYSVGGPKALDVSNIAGNIVITASPDNTLSFEAIKESSAGPDELRKASIDISNAGTFTIRTAYTEPGARVGINYIIRVPANMAIGRITTGSGTISINR